MLAQERRGGDGRVFEHAVAVGLKVWWGCLCPLENQSVSIAPSQSARHPAPRTVEALAVPERHRLVVARLAGLLGAAVAEAVRRCRASRGAEKVEEVDSSSKSFSNFHYSFYKKIKNSI